MSGGLFDYSQHRLIDAVEKIRAALALAQNNNGLDPNENDDTYPQMSPKIRQELFNGIQAIRIAYIYMQRIDWFLSYDDGEENFLMRLAAALKREAAGCDDADLKI